jgi:hypothetical protein
MRSRQLETTLTEFVAEAADRLQAEIDGGAEVGFELAEKSARRGGSAGRLYSYRALTSEFIEQRGAQLTGLPTHAQAVKLLVGFDGLDRYLAANGGGAELGRTKAYVRAGTALKLLLKDVFEEQTDFDRRADSARYEERLEAALARLQQATQASTSELRLLATLHGLTIASEELALTKGLTIARQGALRGTPDGAEGDHLLVVFTAEEGDPDDALAHGREVLRDLLRALRLFGDGRVTLGAFAWARVGAGAWNPIALGAGGRPHGMLVVGADQEDELRAFCNLVSRRAPHDNELAWALRRFELGCERGTGYEALSDHLLALRALLACPREGEPEGSASDLLAGRIAALCATPEDRAKLTKRMRNAQALERAVIAGTADEHAAGLNLARDVSDHLRALLRDVICGHLDSNLAVIADELLAMGDAEEQAIGEEDAPVGEVLASDTRVDPRDSGHERHGEFDEDPLEQLAQRALSI